MEGSNEIQTPTVIFAEKNMRAQASFSRRMLNIHSHASAEQHFNRVALVRLTAIHALGGLNLVVMNGLYFLA